MAEIKAVEYYPSNKGLKNIYSKFLKFGSTEDFDNLILFYTNDIREVDYFEYIYGKREEREEE